MNKHILVASYYFPPNPGIGGRRMAKFCKYLVRKGYIIHVISVENHHEKKSNWIEDINNENIKVYTLPLCYPKLLIMPSDSQKKEQSLLKRGLYKLMYLYYATVKKKRVYDLTFLWEKQFTALAEKLIREFSIENFIVSVSPHYYAYYASQLKKKFPFLNLIIDFRDPWLTLRDFGIQSMNSTQKKNEQKIISKVICNADYLISPSRFVLDEFKPFVSNYDKFQEITHGYDWDDIKNYVNIPVNMTEKIKFIYPGTLYTDILPSILKLKEVLNYLKINYNSIYLNLEFDFYVDELHYADHFKEHTIVRFHKPVGKKIFEKVSEATIILILYAEHNKNYRTTKFYEFLPFQKYYFYIGPKGDTYEFIRKYQLGSSFQLTDTEAYIAENIKQFFYREFSYLPLIHFKDYSFEAQTDKLISMLK